MNKLLKEFLSYILEDKKKFKPGESRKYPGYYMVSRGKYSTKSASGPVTHNLVGGQMIPVKGPDLPTGEKESGEKVSPPETGGTKEPDTTTPDTEQPDGAAGITPSIGDESGKSPVPPSVDGGTAEPFKPSTVFSDRPEVRTTVHADGVTLGQADFRTLPGYPEGSVRRRELMVERKTISEIQKRSPDLTPEEVERKADDINGIIETHNKRVNFLQAEIQKGGTFRDLGTGEEAVSLVGERLNKVLTELVPKEYSEELQSEIGAIINAKTIDEVDAKWAGLRETLEKSNLPDGSIPLICEHLTAIRNAKRGASIMVPDSDSFKLGDIVAYLPQGVGTKNAGDILDGIQIIEVSLDIASVKRGVGAAAAVGSRIDTTSFAGQGVADDLKILGRSSVKNPKKTTGKKDGTPEDKWSGVMGEPGDPGAMREIYDAETQDQLTVVQDRMESVARRRITDIRGYFRIPDTMPDGTPITDDEVMKGLRRGTGPKYDRNGNFVSFGDDASTFSKTDPDGNPMTELNANQLRLYSFVGFLFEAIYNRNCTGQAFSNTSFKPREVVVSDGVRTMGKCGFQFTKQMKWRKVKGKWVLRDDGIAAHIEPTPRNKMGTY
jgi:hypothetical protein